MPQHTINGVALHYRTFGNRKNPTVALSQTVLWGAEVFQPLITALAADFYILDLDLHGHGGSGYRTPLIAEEMAADYAGLLAHLGLAKVTWIGYSFEGTGWIKQPCANAITIFGRAKRPR